MSNKNINPDAISKKKLNLSIEQIISGLEQGDIPMLSKAITFIESKSSKHFDFRDQILAWTYKQRKKAKRVGITGSPGAGKSTMIEQLGLALLEKGDSVAVLSIDPSSALSGGSILGDKTRMEHLSQKERAFIRPSPAEKVLGGVAGATRETIALCEAVGYDWIIVETVGVGQSELAVYEMTDLFVLLLLPGAGDSLQGIKRGIVEMADILVVNKSDGERELLAKQTHSSYRNALQLFPSKESEWQAKIIRTSALKGDGISNFQELINQYFEHINSNAYFDLKRKKQALSWFDDALSSNIKEWLMRNSSHNALMDRMRNDIEAGLIAPGLAADRVLMELLGE